jgi:hypothetical protein
LTRPEIRLLNIFKTLFLVLLLNSCGTTYNKSEFRKFEKNQSQNDLVKKNGYYFAERNSFVYENSTGEYSATDSIIVKSITGIIFYKNGKIYVNSGYSYKIKNQENTLKIAQEKFEKDIDKFNLKTIDREKTHISTLGKYSIQNDTITICFFRFSQGDRLLTELKGKINKDSELDMFQRKNFQRTTFGIFKTKPEIYKISKKYRFKEY